MKKIWIILCCMGMSVLAYPQSNIGVYLGANFAHVNMSSPDLSSDNKTGMQAGVYYRTGKVLYGQLGLEYLSLRTHFTYHALGDIITSEDDVRLHQFALPAYIGVNLIPGEMPADVRIYAGPTLTYLFDVPVNQLDLTIKDFRKVGLTGALGAGLDILFLSVDAGYNFGLSQLFDDMYSGKANYAFVNVGVKF